MNNEARLVKLVIKEIVFRENSREIKDCLTSSNIDWLRFKELISYHELAPFVYPVIKDLDSSVPEDIIEFFKNNYYCSLIRCEKLWREFIRIEGAFKAEGLTILPIKGVALLYDIYQDMPVRPMTDIDLLVKEEDIEKSEQVFYDLGYEKDLYGLKEEYWRNSQCHIAFHKKENNAAFVELHWGLDFKRKNRALLPELWERMREIGIEGRTVKLLSPEDTLFSLALHKRRYGKTLLLKNILDAAILLNKYNSSFDWGYCLSQCRKYNLSSTLFFILYQISFIADIQIPVKIWQVLDVPIWKKNAIKGIITHNTFGLDSIEMKELYLRSHIFLYDSIWEAMGYIFNVPQEQFAKFYGLDTYSKKSEFFYKNRLLYIPYNFCHSLFTDMIGVLRGE